MKDTNLLWKRPRPVYLAHCPAQDLLFYLVLGVTAPISRLLKTIPCICDLDNNRTSLYSTNKQNKTKQKSKTLGTFDWAFLRISVIPSFLQIWFPDFSVIVNNARPRVWTELGNMNTSKFSRVHSVYLLLFWKLLSSIYLSI